MGETNAVTPNLRANGEGATPSERRELDAGTTAMPSVAPISDVQLTFDGYHAKVEGPMTASDDDAEKRSGRSGGSSRVDPADDGRYARAWRVWLEALAHDPEAAWAAALTYRSLDVEGRNAWIDALDVDSKDVGAPAIALYAPLLAVEDDPARRARIETTLLRQGGHGAPAPTEVLRGLRGDRGARRVVVLVHPLYLDFVEVLTCELDGERGFGDVRHDPIRTADQAPKEGDAVDGVELEAVPVEPLIEELAHAVVAHRRKHDALPPALARFVDLFAPRPESVDRLKLNGR